MAEAFVSSIGSRIPERKSHPLNVGDIIVHFHREKLGEFSNHNHRTYYFFPSNIHFNTTFSKLAKMDTNASCAITTFDSIRLPVVSSQTLPQSQSLLDIFSGVRNGQVIQNTPQAVHDRDKLLSVFLLRAIAIASEDYDEDVPDCFTKERSTKPKQ